MTSQPSFIEVQKALSGVDYPARRDQLVQHAKRHGADEGTLKALSKIPDREYEGPSGVSKEVSHVTQT